MNTSLGKFTSLLLIVASLAACHRAPEPSRQEAVRVNTMVAATSDLSRSRSYSGTVEESKGTPLSFTAAGTLQQMHVEDGQRVAKGQLIATIDPGTYENAHQIALATLNEAQDTYNRMKMLHDSNSLPEMQWVQAQNALRAAQSSEAIAKRAVSDCYLYAPTGGYITDKSGEPGLTIVPGIPIAKIVDIDPVKIVVSVPEGEISKIAEKQKAVVKCRSVADRQFEGTVEQRGVIANTLSHTYNVKIQIPNSDMALLPGMICDVQFENIDSVQALILPMPAVMLDAENRNYVWIAKDGKAYKRIVVTDGLSDAGVVIASGIAAGDSVIVKGQQKVSEGIDIISIK